MSLDDEKIMARAYQLSLERIGNGTAPLDDWLKAEWEIKNSFAAKGDGSMTLKTNHGSYEGPYENN
jgi:hypothetical protein